MNRHIYFYGEDKKKQTLDVLTAWRLITASGGKIMRVTFTKRTNGEKREMVCRIGVTKGVKGTGNSNKVTDLVKNHIIRVWDIQKKGFRSINLDTVEEIRMMGHTITVDDVVKTVKKNVNEIKTIKMTAKCSDLCYMNFKNAQGKQVGERDGYVPDFMPGQHWGDYVELEIDVATGKILNWKAPTQKQLRDAIEK